MIGYKKFKFILCIISFILLVALLSSGAVFAQTSTDTEHSEPDTMVKNITVDGGTFTSDFKSNNFTYSVYLKTYRESLSVSVELNDPRFKYAVTGDTLLSRTKDNVAYVVVTDPMGEYEDEKYTLNIFFESIGLTYLDVENGIFSPQFDKFHTTYYVILENDIKTYDDAGVNFTTVNKDAVVEVSCVDELNEDGTLPEGKRTEYRLKVKESDGTGRTYILMLYRKNPMVSSIDENALLASIEINGGVVDTSDFKQRKAFYDITVPPSVKELDIQAYPVDRSNIVEVVGGTVMSKKEPIYVTIIVNSDKYNTKSYYTLRCQYENAMYTPKYTKADMVACVCVCVLSAFIVGFVLAMLIIRRKRKIERVEIRYNYKN